MEREFVYLDFAATAAVRPPEVADAVGAYLRDVGATAGRATHSRSVAASRILFRCRRALSELIGYEGDPGRVVFQLNATHALNAALQGLLRPGDAVVRTRYDHNAVRRPVGLLARSGVEERVLSGNTRGRVDLEEARALLQGDGKPARLLVLPHASNVMGVVLPVRDLADLAHEAGALVLLDAAQTAGHYPIDVEALGVDLLAFAGHKGLLGPQGTGGLWIRDGVEVAATVFGGTGADSDSLEMPASYPERLEAGTQNGPGIAGLLAGIEWVQARGVAELARHVAALEQDLIRRLEAIPRLRIHTPREGEWVGIVLITHDRVPPSDMAARLEREHAVLTRAGLHCAPEAHHVLGTLGSGAVRMSLGWASTASDVERAAAAVAAITGNS